MITPSEAVALQRLLAGLIIQKPFKGKIRFVSGADVHQSERAGHLKGAVSLHSFPDLELVEEVIAEVRCDFPYIPGLLSFREMPALLECFRKLKKKPDIALFDGHGLAHPRRFGIASHMGVVNGIPSIGCAKSRLFGRCIEPGPERGERGPILDPEGNVIGTLLRTKNNVKPVYVSVGHNVSLEQATELVLACTKGYRLPEPLRNAHRLASAK